MVAEPEKVPDLPFEATERSKGMEGTRSSGLGPGVAGKTNWNMTEAEPAGEVRPLKVPEVQVNRSSLVSKVKSAVPEPW